jgi:hypothetical protein
MWPPMGAHTGAPLQVKQQYSLSGIDILWFKGVGAFFERPRAHTVRPYHGLL